MAEEKNTNVPLPEDFMDTVRAKPEPIGEFSTWKEKLLKPLAEIPWVVDRLLVSGTPTLVFGEGGVGKSWFAAHIATSIVSGNSVHGEFPVSERGNVLWYDNENGADENDRRTQLLVDKGFSEFEHDVYMRETPQFHFVGNEAGFDQMRKDIIELSPRLCIVDSMISTLDGEMDENNAKDIRRLIDGIVRTTKDILNPPAFLFIHHSKKLADGSTSEWPEFRGSSDFQNAVGFLVAMRSRHEGGQDYVQFRWNKSRRGQMPKEVFEYSLQDKYYQNPEDVLDVREYVQYVPSAQPKSPYDELLDITRDVLLDNNKHLLEDHLFYFIMERFNKPPTKSHIQNFLYKAVNDKESKIVRNRDAETKSFKFIYSLSI